MPTPCNLKTLIWMIDAGFSQKLGKSDIAYLTQCINLALAKCQMQNAYTQDVKGRYAGCKKQALNICKIQITHKVHSDDGE